MHLMNLAHLALAGFLAFSSLALAAASARAQTTTLVSVALDAVEGSGSSSESSTSADGRYVAFTSDAANLDPGDTNGQPDIFVRDTTTGAITRVSVHSNESQANGGSYTPSISSDGRYVVFQSDATNLVPDDDNGQSDIFVRDTIAGTTTRASVTVNSAQANGGSYFASISANGRFVAFESVASNLVPNDTNGALDVFVRDIVSGTTTRVSVASNGAQGNTTSGDPSISSTGARVAFVSYATNLVSGDTNGKADIFVRDTVAGTTTLVSRSIPKTAGSDDSREPSISADGRYVAFQSAASNLVLGDTNGKLDVFVRDTVGGTTTRASVASNGGQGSGDSSKPSINGNGRYVAFASSASNLVTGDGNGKLDVFVRDTVAGTTERASVAFNETQEDGSSAAPSISGDGRYVAFESVASNLVPRDANGQVDIIMRDTVAGTSARISAAASGNRGNSHSFSPSVSADGRYVAFASLASNLVPGDTNGSTDIFVRDLSTAISTRVSVASNGAQVNDASLDASISADGRYVVFDSFSSDLVPNDINGTWDVFVRDTVAGTTALVSAASNGIQGHGDSHSRSISADGRYVAFYSNASNLVPGDTNLRPDIFVHDMIAGTTARVSVAWDEAQGNGDSVDAYLSADGRYVAFVSFASNLVPGDTNGSADIFVRDLSTATTTLVSVASNGAQGNNASLNASISADGRYVAFDSYSSNLVSEDTNVTPDVFIRDTVAGTTTRVSVAPNGAQGNAESSLPTISADGRYLAFQSVASDLVPGDTNGSADIFVRDLLTATTTLVSAASNGAQGNDDSVGASISADGRYVAFYSDASNLVPGDMKGFLDVFIRAPLPLPYEPADMMRALRITAGLEATDADALARLNTVEDGDSASVVDLRDAVSIARKVAGVEPNPGP